MTKILIDLDQNTNKKIVLYQAKHNITNKKDAIIEILKKNTKN